MIFTQNKSLNKIDAFNPALSFSGLYLLYSISGFFYYSAENKFESLNHTVYIVTCTLGLLAFLAAFLISNSILKKSKYIRIPYVGTTEVYLVLIIFVSLYTFVNPDILRDIIEFDPKPYSEVALRDTRNAKSGPAGFLSEIYIHSIIFILLLSTLHRNKASILGCSMCIFYIIFAIKSGSKGPAIFLFLVLTLNYHYNIKKLNPLLLLSVVIVCIPLFSVFSHVRYVSDFTDMFEIGAVILVENPNLLLPVGFGEFTGPPKTLYNIINVTSGTDSFNWGQRWLEEILVYIPYSLFPDRPLPSSELYVSMFLPNAPIGYGAGWFIVTDGYWAFGYLGVLIIMSLFGVFLSHAHWFYLKNRTNLLSKLGYPYLYFILVITSVRTGFFGSVKVFLMYLSFLIIIFITVRLIRLAS